MPVPYSAGTYTRAERHVDRDRRESSHAPRMRWFRILVLIVAACQRHDHIRLAVAVVAHVPGADARSESPTLGGPHHVFN